MCNLNNSQYGSSKKVSNKYNFMNKGKILEQSDSNAFFKKLKTNEASKYIKGEILFWNFYSERIVSAKFAQ